MSCLLMLWFHLSRKNIAEAAVAFFLHGMNAVYCGLRVTDVSKI